MWIGRCEGRRIVSRAVSAWAVVGVSQVARAEPLLSVIVPGERPAIGAPESSRHHHVLDAQTLAEEAPRTVADALRHAPAASVQQTTPAQATIYVRGLSGRELAHVVDGVRLNSAIYRAGNVPYLALVDIQALDRIDIVPGPSSVLYGSDALAGAVLMRTRLPGYGLGEPVTEVRLRQSLTSNPLASTSRAELTQSFETFAIRMGATLNSVGPITPGEGVSSPNPDSYVGLERDPGGQYRPMLERPQRGTEYQFFSADLTARHRLGARKGLMLRAQHSAIPELVRYDQVTPRFKQETPARHEARIAPLMRTMASLAFSHAPAGSWFDELEVQFGWQRLAEDVYGRGLGEECLAGEPPADDESCPGATRLRAGGLRSLEKNRSDAFSLNAELELPIGSPSHDLRFGATALHDIVSSSTDQTSLASGESTPAPPRFPDGSSFSEFGLFALVESELSDHVRLYLGGRTSLFHVAISERPALPDEASSPGQDLSLLDWSASAGVIVTPTPGLEFDVNVGRAIRAPNVQDLAALGPRAGGRYQVPNPDLKPENSLSGDVGTRFSHGKHYLDTSIFLLHYRDAIDLASTSVDGQSASPEGDDYVQSINAASVRLAGIETSAEVRLVPPVALFARGLAILGEQRNPSKSGLPATTPADRTPPYQGELGGRFFLSGSLEVRPFVSFRNAAKRLNDPTNLEDNRIPEGGTPGFATLHLHIAYAIQNLTARLNFDNILDELVLEHGSGFYRPGFAATGSVEARIF
jgi:outer membrane receptor protein involved in Fe transport